MDPKDIAPALAELQKVATERVNQLETRNRELAERVQLLEQRPAPGGPNPGGPTRPETAADVLAKSPAMAAFRAGETKSVRINVPTVSLHTKATMVSTMAAGAPFRAEPVAMDMPLRVSVRSLIPQRNTSAGSVEYIRLTRSGLAAVQVAEGDVKAEVDLGPVLIRANVVTIAGWTPVSRQIFDDDPSLRDIAGMSLMDALQWAEDLEILKGDGTAGHMQGIIPLASAYTRTTAGDTAADVCRRAATQIHIARGFPDGLVLPPQALEEIELIKTTQGAYVLELEVDVLNRTTLWRIPTIVSNALTATEFLLGSFSMGTMLYDRQMALVEISQEDSDNFRRNLLTVRAEERAALCVTRPMMFVHGTLP